METRILMKLSAIIDKIGIKDELKNIDKATNEEVGKELIVLLISKLYKAEQEVYELISIYKNIDVEQAKTENIVPIIKEMLKIDGIKDFLV